MNVMQMIIPHGKAITIDSCNRIDFINIQNDIFLEQFETVFQSEIIQNHLTIHSIH